MLNIFLILIGVIVIAISVVAIFDARKIATKHFNKGETNNATTMIKIIGFIVFAIGAIIVILA